MCLVNATMQLKLVGSICHVVIPVINNMHNFIVLVRLSNFIMLVRVVKFYSVSQVVKCYSVSQGGQML